MGISGIARRVADVPRQGVVLALEGPQQLAELWDDVAQLVRRASRVLDRVDLIVARLEQKVDEAETLLTRSSETREAVDDQVGRLRRLLDLYQPMLQALAPLGSEAAATMKPSHLLGLSKLFDEIPQLVDSLAPALESMASLSPHMEDVTDRMTNVGQVVEGLPGAKRLRKRGQEREESSD